MKRLKYDGSSYETFLCWTVESFMDQLSPSWAFDIWFDDLSSEAPYAYDI